MTLSPFARVETQALFILFFIVLFGRFLACFAAVYALHVWLLINQLPFCQEAAYAWMIGELGTSVCIEEDIAASVPWLGYSGPTSAVSGLPVPYPVQYFFGYDPNYFGGRWHGGVDMPCPVGTPIQATMPWFAFLPPRFSCLPAI